MAAQLLQCPHSETWRLRRRRLPLRRWWTSSILRWQSQRYLCSPHRHSCFHGAGELPPEEMERVFFIFYLELQKMGCVRVCARVRACVRAWVRTSLSNWWQQNSSRPHMTPSILVCVSGCQISGAWICYTSCSLLNSASPLHTLKLSNFHNSILFKNFILESINRADLLCHF